MPTYLQLQGRCPARVRRLPQAGAPCEARSPLWRADRAGTSVSGPGRASASVAALPWAAAALLVLLRAARPLTLLLLFLLLLLTLSLFAPLDRELLPSRAEHPLHPSRRRRAHGARLHPEGQDLLGQLVHEPVDVPRAYGPLLNSRPEHEVVDAVQNVEPVLDVRAVFWPYPTSWSWG